MLKKTAEFLFEVGDWVSLTALLSLLLYCAIYRLKTVYNLQNDYINSRKAHSLLGQYTKWEHMGLLCLLACLIFFDEMALTLVFGPWSVAKLLYNLLGGNTMALGEMHKKGYMGNYKTFGEVGFFMYFVIFWIFVFRVAKEVIDEVVHKEKSRAS